MDSWTAADFSNATNHNTDAIQ